MIKYFKTLEPVKSKVEKEIHEHDSEHLNWNEELHDKMFLEGDGFSVGAKDVEAF